jgi:hypothetical protein
MMSGSDAIRVRSPMPSAATWSSEIVLRNAALPGWGAAVRNDFSAWWKPSTCGWETPENTVKSSRKSFRISRYGVSA